MFKCCLSVATNQKHLSIVKNPRSIFMGEGSLTFYDTKLEYKVNNTQRNLQRGIKGDVNLVNSISNSSLPMLAVTIHSKVRIHFALQSRK